MRNKRIDKYGKLGDMAFNRMEKVNADLFVLTYGSLVTQLLRDIEDVDAVNAQLEKMGYNIGLRLIDEFLSKSGINACQDFRDTCEVIAKVGLRMFLGVSGEVENWQFVEYSYMFPCEAWVLAESECWHSLCSPSA